MSYAYCANPLDRAARSRQDPDWLARRLSDRRTRIVLLAGESPYMRIGENACPQPYWSIDTVNCPLDAVCAPVFLGLDEAGTATFAALLPCDGDGAPQPGRAPHGGRAIDLRSLAAQGVLPPQELGVLAQARSLLGWHATSRYCTTCAGECVSAEGGYKRVCRACGREHFPRTDPVVIMLVTHGDDCLLGRQPHFLDGMYSALAGFVEPGESIEEAARREIAEEAGIAVGAVRYHSSQPWPFPSTLMLGLIGEATSRDIDIDTNELEHARWFSRAEAARMLAGTHEKGLRTPANFAIAYHLIREFVQSG